MWEIWANLLLPKALKSCPKSKNCQIWSHWLLPMNEMHPNRRKEQRCYIYFAVAGARTVGTLPNEGYSFPLIYFNLHSFVCWLCLYALSLKVLKHILLYMKNLIKTDCYINAMICVKKQKRFEFMPKRNVLPCMKAPSFIGLLQPIAATVKLHTKAE